MDLDEEIAWVAAAKSGDLIAWDQLLQRLQMPLYIYLCQLTRNDWIAMDLVQESFIAAVRHLPTLKENEKFRGWLFRIAHQKVAQHWRTAWREQPWTEDLTEKSPAPEPGPDELLINKEQEALFFHGLDKLPPDQRSVLVLHFLEEFSIDEISRITGLPSGTVKSRIHYAKNSLKKALSQ